MLILASASPRRRELLTLAGYSFEIQPANIPEDPFPNEDPYAYVSRLSQQKAEAVFRLRADPAAIVLGCDTTVTIERPAGTHHILGKPENAEDAARMLRLLSSRAHRVITGISLVFQKGIETSEISEKSASALPGADSSRLSTSPEDGLETAAITTAEITTVHFLPLTEQQIHDYIATGEPNDKAGAYAIQGQAARWIPRIEGCYYNVMGLPLSRVATLLENLDQSR
jgi:septum formation protein